MARRRRMHGKRRHKSSCPPFKMHHTEEALLNNPDISVDKLERDHGLSTETHDVETLEDGTEVWSKRPTGEKRRPTGDIINNVRRLPKMKPLPDLKFKKLPPPEPFDASRYQVKRPVPTKIKPLEAKPIEQQLSTKDIKTGGSSIADTLPKKRFENKPYYTMRSSGFQVQTATSIWDEKTRSWKQRRMEPEEIQYQDDQIKKRLNKKKGNR